MLSAISTVTRRGAGGGGEHSYKDPRPWELMVICGWAGRRRLDRT